MISQKEQRILKARAIVIKEKDVGESNKQLTIIAKGTGKLSVFAKGARNLKSNFFAGTHPFCYCDFVLYNGGGFLSVTQIDLIRNFSAYYDDVYKLMYGSFFLELADKTVMFSQESDDVLILLLKGLHNLEKTDSPRKISAAFQIKLFDLLGVCPDADVCSLCGEKSGDGALFFPADGSSAFEGFVCSGCGKGELLKAAPGTLEAIRYIKEAKSGADVFRFNAAENVLDELYGFSEMIAASQLETDLLSPQIIKSL